MTVDDPLQTLAMRLAERLCVSSGFAPHMISTPRVLAYLRARLSEHGLSHVRSLESLLATNAREYAQLEQLFSPAETWLFRYPESFALLREHMPTWLRSSVLHVASLGCGGWSEPISIAATLVDAWGAATTTTTTTTTTCTTGVSRSMPASEIPIRIVAVDRNAALVEQKPVFEQLQLRGGVPQWAVPYFAWESRNGFDIARPRQMVCALVQETSCDIASWIARETRAGAKYHAIYFRNVAIYMHDALRAQIFRGITQLLAEDGLLFVGHAEVELAARFTDFESVDTSGAFALKRRSAVRRVTQPVERSDMRAHGVERLRSTRNSSDEALPTNAPQATPTTAAPDPKYFLRIALECESRREFDLAEKAVTRALYLDRRDQDALVLAARLAELRGASADAQRYRMRALQAHLDQHASADDHSDEANSSDLGKGC